MRRCALLPASFALLFVLSIDGRASAGDGGGSSCDGGEGTLCSPSDGGVVDDGGTCRAVGGRCVSLDAGAECGELLSGLPCSGDTMCCVIASANADGSAVFDSAVCVAVGEPCTPGDSCCQGASCAEYSGDAFVCGVPSLDAGVDAASAVDRRDAATCATCGPHADAATSAHTAGSSGGCSCRVGAVSGAPAPSWSLAAVLLFLVNRRRRLPLWPSRRFHPASTAASCDSEASVGASDVASGRSPIAAAQAAGMHAWPSMDARHDTLPGPQSLEEVHAIVQNHACAGTLKSAVHTAAPASRPVLAH